MLSGVLLHVIVAACPFYAACHITLYVDSLVKNVYDPSIQLVHIHDIDTRDRSSIEWLAAGRWIERSLTQRDQSVAGFTG